MQRTVLLLLMVFSCGFAQGCAAYAGKLEAIRYKQLGYASVGTEYFLQLDEKLWSTVFEEGGRKTVLDVPNALDLCGVDDELECFVMKPGILQFAIPRREPTMGSSWKHNSLSYRVVDILEPIGCQKEYVIESRDQFGNVHLYVFNTVYGLRAIYHVGKKNPLPKFEVEQPELAEEDLPTSFDSAWIANGPGFGGSGSCGG